MATINVSMTTINVGNQVRASFGLPGQQTFERMKQATNAAGLTIQFHPDKHWPDFKAYNFTVDGPSALTAKTALQNIFDAHLLYYNEYIPRVLPTTDSKGHRCVVLMPSKSEPVRESFGLLGQQTVELMKKATNATGLTIQFHPDKCRPNVEDYNFTVSGPSALTDQRALQNTFDDYLPYYKGYIPHVLPTTDSNGHRCVVLIQSESEQVRESFGLLGQRTFELMQKATTATGLTIQFHPDKCWPNVEDYNFTVSGPSSLTDQTALQDIFDEYLPYYEGYKPQVLPTIDSNGHRRVVLIPSKSEQVRESLGLLSQRTFEFMKNATDATGLTIQFHPNKRSSYSDGYDFTVSGPSSRTGQAALQRIFDAYLPYYKVYKPCVLPHTNEDGHRYVALKYIEEPSINNQYAKN